MRSLYLSAPVRLSEVPADAADSLAGPYRAAYEGVVALCEQQGWHVCHSLDAGADAQRLLESSDAFVALRFAHMRTALMPNFELMNAVGKTQSGRDRPVLVFKLEATTEFDEHWLGTPGAVEIVGDPQLLLEHVKQTLSQ